MNTNRDNSISIFQYSCFNKDRKAHESITPEQARGILDFQIEKVPVSRQVGNRWEKVPGQYCLVRKDNTDDEGIQVGLGCVGEQFEVAAQPTQVLDFFLEHIMPEVPELKIETVASVFDGATTFVNFHYGDGYEFKNDSSPQYTNILFMNPLTRGRLCLLSHTIRVICQNTLRYARQTGTGFTINHTRNGEFYVKAALEAIGIQLKKAASLKELSIKLDSMLITSKNIGKILDEIYPVKKTKKGEESTRMLNIRNDVLAQFETDSSFKAKTAWAFLNAMTYKQEHPKMTANRDPMRIGTDNLFGGRAEMKAQMLNAVVKEMGIKSKELQLA
jgi:hypothetical protein